LIKTLASGVRGIQIALGDLGSGRRKGAAGERRTGARGGPSPQRRVLPLAGARTRTRRTSLRRQPSTPPLPAEKSIFAEENNWKAAGERNKKATTAERWLLFTVPRRWKLFSLSPAESSRLPRGLCCVQENSRRDSHKVGD